MRDAALNLALSHPFAGELANPRQMTPYTYADSPTVSPDDPAFAGGPVPGAVLPDARLGAELLSDCLGPGFSLVVFGTALAETATQLGLTHVIVPPQSETATILKAGPQSAYLVRPDMHIAARWFEASRREVRDALKRATAGGRP